MNTLLIVIAVIFTLIYLMGKSVAAAHVFFRKRNSGIILRIALPAALIAILVVAPIKGCEFMQVALYKDAIPLQLELDQLVYHDEENDLREGCGVSIFKLSDKTLNQINGLGLAYLATATLGRDGDAYHLYKPWLATPQPGKMGHEHELLRGSQCIDNPPDIWKEIEKATYEGGAYFTTGYEQDIVIVPKLGVLVFSYNG